MTWLTYAGLSREAFMESRLSWKQQPSKIVLHSTEGGSYPSAATYRYGESAPHFTVDVRKRNCRQHYPLTKPAYALKATSLVSTNTMGAIQIEIIGSCVPGQTRMQSVLNFNDDDLRYLAGLLKEISRATGIPLRTTVEFIAYPASYGASRVRLGASAWTNYRGVCGHMHVPGNTHGDPGTLNVARLLELANGAPAPAPAPIVKEEKMKHLRIARQKNTPEVWVGDGITRRHITTENELNDLRYVISSVGGDNTVHEVDSIAWLGEVSVTKDSIWQVPVFDNPDGSKVPAWVALRVAYLRKPSDIDEAALAAALGPVLNGIIDLGQDDIEAIANTTIARLKETL